MKSRVLLSVRDELEDDGLFGPNVPMKNTADVHEFANSSLKTNTSLMGTMPLVWELLSFKVPHNVNFPQTNSSRLELPFSNALQDNFYSKVLLTANKLQPDITASAENLLILASDNTTAKIEKPLTWTVNTDL